MAKLVIKLIAAVLIFTFGMTLSSEFNQPKHSIPTVSNENIVTSSKALYLSDGISEAQEDSVEEKQQYSFPYKIAQSIEKTGLLMYEGLIKIVSDLADVI
ncbi:hypothetical protein [Amphibacillus cookii]|uniref:hypothetical protein n=1 Tax=Amphibacillus cookii TaxID=767787 RepID=UPI0019576592|nr:hypothetical protein [Amphibacillus cookii]MBM7541688.1 hypothetical protein [Amphibacillus cookii]